ncbi:MAG: DUF1189 family protein [Legionella sp.]|nr:DUF1189 family protein [Legionella sp.]
MSSQLKPLDMPVYNYWSALYKSFYSNLLYIDVGKRWKGLGLLYLFLVIGLLTIPYSLKIMEDFSVKFDNQLIKPLEQIPPLYLQNGKISLDKPMPFLIKDDKNQVVIVIDTTGKIKNFTNEYPAMHMLITADKLFFKPPVPQLLNQGNNSATTTPNIHTFSPNMNGIFSGKQFVSEKRVAHLKWITQALLYPIFLALFCSIALVIFPILALLAQFFTLVFFSFRLGYKQACRLLIVSATPMLCVLFLFLCFNLMFSGTGVIITLLLVGYFSFAVVSLKRNSQLLSQDSKS